MRLKSALIGLAVLGAAAMTAGTASAMPNGLPTQNQASNVDQVRYVCNAWGRCWWRPNYRSYGFYGPRPYYGPRFYGGYGGWHRGWHGHRHHGWGHRHR
jgi:hypothetical protein